MVGIHIPIRQPLSAQNKKKFARQILAATTVRDLPREVAALIREISCEAKIDQKTGVTKRTITIKFRGHGLPVLQYTTQQVSGF